MLRIALAVTVVLASGCVTDASSRRLLDGLKAGSVSAELLAADVTLVTASGPVKGRDAVAAGLAALKPSAAVDAHHDVARVALADQSLVFAKSDGQGHVTTVLVFPPGGDDPVPPGVKAYQDAWTKAAPYALLELAWSARGVYQDPLSEAHGRAELGRMIADFHKAYTDLSMANRGPLQALPGGYVTFGWEFHMGATVLKGFDVGFLDDEGKLALISGFFSPR